MISLTTRLLLRRTRVFEPRWRVVISPYFAMERSWYFESDVRLMFTHSFTHEEMDTYASVAGVSFAGIDLQQVPE